MSPLLSICITLIAFQIGIWIYKKTNFVLFNPLVVALIIIITILSIFKIPVKEYNKGGDMIFFFLAPATVLLAVPLYKQRETLKKNLIPILAGITVGSFTAVFSVLFLSKSLGLSKELIQSLLSKSITTAIGIEITKELGGNSSITVAAIVLTGIVGGTLGPLTLKLFGVKEKIAVGLAMGTASHAIGTSKAVELGEVEGAMSGLAIGIAGIFTVFIVPLAIYFL